MKNFILLFLLFLSPYYYSQTIIYYDRMESYTWSGNWWVGVATSGFFTNASTSASYSAVLYGAGNGGSAIEQDWYSLPNITGLNSTYTYDFKFRLGSYRFTGGGTRGVDASDLIQVQISTDGGSVYNSEIEIDGFNNAYWNYNNVGSISKVSTGTNTVYNVLVGGDRSASVDGYSTINLTLPAGITQIAVDIFCRVNSSGEEWWIDDIELIETIVMPIELEVFDCNFINNNEIEITWSTLSEINNSFFIIEHSLDEQSWQIINTVLGSGTSNVRNDYSYLHFNTFPGMNYYKLTQVDFDGQRETFTSIVCENPTNNEIIKVSYYDLLGQEIIIPIKGMYIQVVEYKNNTITTNKMCAR